MLNPLTRKILETIPYPVFSATGLGLLTAGSDDSTYALAKRAVAQGDLLSLRRGLYALPPLFRVAPLDPYLAAQEIYGPSYVSLEAALSLHGWIPEAVHTITCVTNRLPRDFETPLGLYSYRHSRQKALYAGVTLTNAPNGQTLMLATPLKALADYVETKGLTWNSCAPLVESLRIEPSQLGELRIHDFEELEGNYRQPRVRRFLAGIRKELAR
jgi:hypothetical protein